MRVDVTRNLRRNILGLHKAEETAKSFEKRKKPRRLFYKIKRPYMLDIHAEAGPA